MWVREGLEIPLTVNPYCYGQKMVTGHKEDLQIIICGALKIKWLTAPHSQILSLIIRKRLKNDTGVQQLTRWLFFS